MVVLREIKPGRLLRMDDVNELGENTLDKLKKAIEAGDKELALKLADYQFLESKGVHDAMLDWVYVNLDWIGRNYGEEEVAKAVRYMNEVHGSKHPGASGLSALALVQFSAEFCRGHGSGPEEKGDFKAWEEKDRWVMSFDPCGSGGRLARGPKDGTGSRTKPPFNLGKTTKPYPWAWNKVGVPYYCTHCCIWSEIMAIERNGYPTRVTEFPADDPSKPCVWYMYKDPNLIPEKYFTRVGFKKDPSRFKKAPEKK